jgi:hypothetical protein
LQLIPPSLAMLAYRPKGFSIFETYVRINNQPHASDIISLDAAAQSVG